MIQLLLKYHLNLCKSFDVSDESSVPPLSRRILGFPVGRLVLHVQEVPENTSVTLLKCILTHRKHL